MTGNISEAVVAVVPKSTDLETHLRLVMVDGVQVVELRDYIPSLHEYGRGYWVQHDRDTLDILISGLKSVARTAV